MISRALFTSLDLEKHDGNGLESRFGPRIVHMNLKCGREKVRFRPRGM